MLAYVFSGQGIQRKGMGKDVFEEFPNLVREADELLGYSIKEVCLNNPHNILNQTEYAQPAIFIVNALTYLKLKNQNNIVPDYVVGHSLGEYNALFAAEAFDWKTGISLVKERGKLMGEAKGGGMAAVIGLSEITIKKILLENNLESIDIANFNTPTQIVVSGPTDAIALLETHIKKEGGRYVILNVSGAFHSRYMRDAQLSFEKYISKFTFSSPQIPVISNLTAKQYTLENMKETLLNQISNSVKWTESIRYLMKKNVTDIRVVGDHKEMVAMINQISTMNAKYDRDKSDEIELGNKEFKELFKLKHAYVAGSMYRGISGVKLILRMARAGMLAFLGTGGLTYDEIEKHLNHIQTTLGNNYSYGANIIYNFKEFNRESQLINLYLEKNIDIIEASAYLEITSSLALYRLKGIKKNSIGEIEVKNRIFAKISRPEIAELFMSPPSEFLLKQLLNNHQITIDEYELGHYISMADAITVESDSGGHTDRGVVLTLLPTILHLRENLKKKNKVQNKIFIGAAGGIGTPESVATMYILGADYVQTGSINQCTIEAETSDSVKDLLQIMNVQDTEYVPSGDLFELGSQIQVLKKSVFFPARAKKLYEFYISHNCLEEIDCKTREILEQRYFKKSIEELYHEIYSEYSKSNFDISNLNGKQKMALIFKWYFSYSSLAAINGDPEGRVDYQIHCGSALGAFNQWVKGTYLESWRERHVDDIGIKLLKEAEDYLKNNKVFKQYFD